MCLNNAEISLLLWDSRRKIFYFLKIKPTLPPKHCGHWPEAVTSPANTNIPKKYLYLILYTRFKVNNNSAQTD